MGLLTEDTWRQIDLGGVLGLGELHGVVCVMMCLELPGLCWSAAHLWSFVLSSLHQFWWQPVQPAAGVTFLCLPYSGHAGGTGFPARNKENTWHCSSSSPSDKGRITEGWWGQGSEVLMQLKLCHPLLLGEAQQFRDLGFWQLLKAKLASKLSEEGDAAGIAAGEWKGSELLQEPNNAGEYFALSQCACAFCTFYEQVSMICHLFLFCIGL